MLASIPSATLLGVDGHPVTVEVHVAVGIPSFAIVGLPDAACREARDRIRAALATSGIEWPNKKITVNLAPSGLRKIGSGLDLAMAVGLLVASERVPSFAVDGVGFVGELGLDGSIRPVPGVLSLVDALECRSIVVGPGAYHEAALLSGARVQVAWNLVELFDALLGLQPWPGPPPQPQAPPEPPPPDLADVRGQPVARFALEVAAAGNHHVLFVGPPGAGKTMLARRLPGLLPPLDDQIALESTRVHSAAGMGRAGGLMRRPPFRSPHHGASSVSLAGGGSGAVRPGEISLAHGGVLFLDELGEFQATVLDVLRQPLEEGVIRVARAAVRVELPAQFLLVAAMNPCPCGEGGILAMCRCSPAAQARYRRRVSGPLLDRFDLRVEVARPEVDHLLVSGREEPSAAVAARVARARALAHGRGVRSNAELRGEPLDEAAPLTAGAKSVLETALRAGRLSGRGASRVRAVARTIADLRDAKSVDAEHIALAMTLRVDPFDRFDRVAS
ncbi:MAG TPA: YifB family Mg chelatase-like AAA ATPase [Acidimicrobiales bacterium]